MHWWGAELWADNPVKLISWIVVIIGSIVLHELAHGWVATWLGDDTPRLSGHLTLNPVVHIPPMAWLLLAAFGFTWGLMPINPARLRGRYAESLVAFAGPLTNLLIAVGGTIAMCLWLGFGEGHWVSGFKIEEPLFINTARFWWYAVMLNLILFLLNLLPVPPLDGWRIASNLIPSFGRIWTSERGAQIGLGLFILLFFFGADYIVQFGGRVAAELLAIATELTVPASDITQLNL